MSDTYDEQTRLALCVGLAEDLICDDEVCNADAKAWRLHAMALAHVLREAAADYIRQQKYRVAYLCDDTNIGYTCSRPIGHAGEHRALGAGDNLLYAWTGGASD